MRLGTPGRVVRIETDGSALVDIAGVNQNVRLALLTAARTRVEPGDWLLVQLGVAVARLSPSEASRLVPVLERLRARLPVPAAA